MSLENLAKGYYGREVVVTVQEDGSAVDVSEFTTRVVVLRAPGGAAVKEKVAAFVSDGTDGQLTFTFADGDLDAVGEWLLQVQLTKVVEEVTTQFVPSSVVAFTVGVAL